ncbi:MAG: four helix bundle protein [Deltaproteobacteria bacterium]|nr:four helix bundle protein [Deltaproteobacteria bacterium]
MLSFQRLDVYQRSIQFLVLAIEVIAKLPRGHADLASQLRSSAQSTIANIAEGAGRRTRADAAHHYFMARGSAMESAAHLDVMKAMAILDEARYREGIDLLESVVAMLTKMCAG